MRAKQQPLVPLLQRRAVDELCRVEQPGERNQRQEDQPPGREPPRRIEQETRIGAVPGDGSVHVVDGEIYLGCSFQLIVACACSESLSTSMTGNKSRRDRVG